MNAPSHDPGFQQLQQIGIAASASFDFCAPKRQRARRWNSIARIIRHRSLSKTTDSARADRLQR